MNDKSSQKRILTFQLDHFYTYIKIAYNVSFLLIIESFCAIRNLISPKKPENVKGQLCLVTGAANGLGRCLAIELASRGCNIAIADISDPSETVKEIKEKFGVQCAGFKCDISDVDSITKLKNDVKSSMGDVDILVNNAGIILTDRILQCSMEAVSRCVDVNLTSNIKMIKTFLPDMIENQKGRIVAISSMGAKITVPVLSIYCATKFGVDGLMEALYDELCYDGHENAIKLTTAFPYFIYTNPNVADMINTLRDPFPRYLPEEVAKVTVDGVLIDKRKIYIVPTSLMLLVQKLPDSIIRYFKKIMNPPHKAVRVAIVERDVSSSNSILT